MILFFRTPQNSLIAVESNQKLTEQDCSKLKWLFNEAILEPSENIEGYLVGPRPEMITPWSTNAVEITQNMGIHGIERIEEFFPVEDKNADYDPMLQHLYNGLNQRIFISDKQPDKIVEIEDIAIYNEKEGLAMSKEEITYLEELSTTLNRKLTDSEVFGFAQINSEHCRHKIFGGTFIIDGEEKESSLFNLIKKTTKENPNKIISAYKDNVAFAKGPKIELFAPSNHAKADFFKTEEVESVISIKAETHNFPTTVEPFNGASTGTGGEIRDRMAGGKGSWPIAGTAVYMTSYPRLDDERFWENLLPIRKWLYQAPEDILIKASNGASDFGNKFGQPLICGSVLTFEHTENNENYGYDKVIMLAGGVGYGRKRDALKGEPTKGNKIVLLGGDNYRIGLGGGSVSSVDTGKYSSGIELNAVQRANAEMQKRANNVVRALSEEENNPIISIHDHGSAGHVNCLSELVEGAGGKIDMDQLPIGDKTLSAKEIIANESQERMGLLVEQDAIDHIRKIAEREKSPMYVVGETTGDNRFFFEQADKKRPFDLMMDQMFGSSPKTIMTDSSVERHYEMPQYTVKSLHEYVEDVLTLEAVACKDWLTNKVDRSVTGKVARQQCQGELQLPLSDCGVVALDYRGKKGIATSIGHAPQAGLADPAKGSILSVSEALTNIVFAPLSEKLATVSLSANWMWPCRSQKGEDARLYSAVEALSDFCCQLGINVPTGKDSLSMTQKYPDGEQVVSPGTVIVSAAGEVSDIKKTVSPVIINCDKSSLYHIDFSFDTFKLGGSAFAQTLGKIGDEVPSITDPDYFAAAFNAVQEAVEQEYILAGHDISAGGIITTLLEMCFANTEGGINLNLNKFVEQDLVKLLFAENPGIIVQIADKHLQAVNAILEDYGVSMQKIGYPTEERHILVEKEEAIYQFGIDYLRDIWYSTSYLLDKRQALNGCAKERFENYKKQPLEFAFAPDFKGSLKQFGLNPQRKGTTGVQAAIIREKGTNGDREMAYALYLAGFDVKDVTMTDLINGSETLDSINLIVFCGGFSNSDVLGSAKGWAGGFLFNPKAKETLQRYYEREDTLSLGICNGCQLMIELNLIYPNQKEQIKMRHNNSMKFESSFVGLTIPTNRSVMFGSLSGYKLGVWVAHGEGKFDMPYEQDQYNIVAQYSYSEYPGNPNGSKFDTAAIASKDGRHIAMMPHLERSIFPWQNGFYLQDRIGKDQITPWISAFSNAKNWIERKKK